MAAHERLRDSRDLADEIRYITALHPGVWTIDRLRTAVIDRGCRPAHEAEFEERLAFALSCLVAGHEAERLGFDSYRIYPHAGV